MNLFMDWSLFMEGLMHKGIIRLLKGVFMDKYSVSLALDMCVVALGHIKCISPGNALFNIQCDTIINEITTAKGLINGLDSDTQLLLDNLVRIDNRLAEALGYFFLYRTVQDGSLIMSIDKDLSDAAIGLLSIIPKECDVRV